MNTDSNRVGRGFQNMLLAAPVTPFCSDGELNCELIERQAAVLAEREVDGFYIGGRTGEGSSLSTVERMHLAEEWRAATTAPVLVNVGHACLKDAQELAAHAARIGADGFSSEGGPWTYPSSTVDDLVGWCGEISSHAPDLPFFFYFNSGSTPGLSKFNPADFCRIALKRIPNFAGVKYSQETLKGAMDCAQVDPEKIEVFFGKDEMLLAGLAMGIGSVIGGTYNLFSPLARRIIVAFEAGDLRQALEYQVKLNACISLLGKFGGLVAVKAAMPLIGLNCGPVRSPLNNLNAEQATELRNVLQATSPELWMALGRVST